MNLNTFLEDKHMKLMNWKIFNLIIVFLYISSSAFAQVDLPVIDYKSPKEYEIGGITVEGLKYRDDKAIVAVSGLRVGNKITIPGAEIPKAIRQLLKLKLFTDIEIIQEKTLGDITFLKIKIAERPTLSKYSFRGVKRAKQEDLLEVVDNVLLKGGIVTEDMKQLAKTKLEKHYNEKGYFDSKVKIEEYPDESKENAVGLRIFVDRGKRVRIDKVSFTGNNNVGSNKLRRKMKNTKWKWNILKKSKFNDKDFEEDKKALIAYYNNIGYRDAKIVRDSIWRRDNGNMEIQLSIDEGQKYYFRNIVWKGNSVYDEAYLEKVLGIEKGDVYNNELLMKRLSFSLDGRDISSLYMDDGYLMFRIEPVEKAIENDSIDIEVRMTEGPQVTIDKVVIQGNDRTHENVIRRELRTRPGSKFSRTDLIRSQRQIINLGYFNPEALGIETPVNAQRGTVDIVYNVEEKPSDQFEVSAGYGGYSGLIGTMGVSFNNFSLQNISKRETWNPLPQGDGQKLSIRAQSNSRTFKSYNISFTEPWLGGKRPTSLTVGGVYSLTDGFLYGFGKLGIARGFVGIGSQLKWPDDYFSYFVTLNLENINLEDYRLNQFGISNGSFNNFSIKQVLTRSSVNEPVFPRRGSKISLTLQLTPYYFWRKGDYFKINPEDAQQLIRTENLKRGFANKLNASEELEFINDVEAASKFKYLEYHKWRLDGEWYFNLVDKLVLKTEAKVGLLGYYRKKIGVSPFERFELGGNGLNNQSVAIQGKDIISSRGYDIKDFDVNKTSDGGATIFNKFTVELRYPLSTNPNSTFFVTAFAQGANAYDGFSNYNPFDLKRSAGVGLRVFLPMFGLMGFDYGFGFDRTLNPNAKLTDYARFNVVLGFEPD